MNVSVSDFFSFEFSIKLIIFWTVESFDVVVACTFINDSLLIQPLSMFSSFATFLGTDSPVKEEVSIYVSPSTTTPSNGTFSPAFTINISPTFASSNFTLPLSSIFTVSTLKSINLVIEALLLLTAKFSKYSPNWNNKITINASSYEWI